MPARLAGFIDPEQLSHVDLRRDAGAAGLSERGCVRGVAYVLEVEVCGAGREHEDGNAAVAEVVENVRYRSVAARDDDAVKGPGVCHGLLGLQCLADAPYHDLVARGEQGMNEGEYFVRMRTRRKVVDDETAHTLFPF